MAIPEYQKMLTPIMIYALDNAEHSIRDLIFNLSDYFRLSEEDKKLKIYRRKQMVFDNRVRWSCTYLKKAGFLISSKRGNFIITRRGSEYMQNNAEVDMEDLKQYDEFKEFLKPKFFSGLKKIV